MCIVWDNTIVTAISSIEIEMPNEARVSIFLDNDLTTINDDHFEINLVAQLLNQMYIVPAPPPRYDYYDDTLEGAVAQPTPSTLTGATALAPPFSFTVQKMYSHISISILRNMILDVEILCSYAIVIN